MLLSDSITVLKNIGKEREKMLNSFGIFNIKNLLEYFPRDYDDRSKTCFVSDIVPEKKNTLRVRLLSAPELRRVKNLFIVKAKICDESGEITAVWFNQPYLKNYFTQGSEYILTGKIIDRLGKLQIESPDYEVFSETSLNNLRIVPIYYGLGKLSQKIFRAFIKNALDETSDYFQDYIPDNELQDLNLCRLDYAIRNIHFPETNDSFYSARKRLVFDELLTVITALRELKSVIRRKSTVRVSSFDQKEILNLLPYSLTGAQSRVMDEITGDFKSGQVMSRLIQGDVGSGKTAIAALCCYLLIKSGYQAVIMAPTEVLAEQHFRFISKLFSRLDIETVFLSSSVKGKSKLLTNESISSGKAQMIIGTHALIQEKVQFSNLGLVVTDEQHRFGVRQRTKLSEKGDFPHTLIMTATPIPRTLALILYGDLDISVIDELPPGRQKTDTLVVNSSYRDRIYRFIQKEIDAKSQCYIICPAIEDDEKRESASELKAVISYTERLKKYFPGYSVEFLHGKMKNDEKNSIMGRFINRETDVLVSTTVIEVGINNPNATVMVIENADRFGLSQLHQLRGRVGRGSDKSYCILISDSKSKITSKRLDIMRQSNDGFVISELDLKLRGHGDFFGTRQAGLPEFKIANLYEDIEILKTALEFSEKIADNQEIMSKLAKISKDFIESEKISL